MFNLISAELVEKLWEVFPDSFSCQRRILDYDEYPGRFGYERTNERVIVENLAADILNTAQATSRGGAYMQDALRYIEEYKPKWIQRREMQNFLRHGI